MPLDGADCNALLLVCQKLNHVSSVQLRRSLHALRISTTENTMGCTPLSNRD